MPYINPYLGELHCECSIEIADLVPHQQLSVLDGEPCHLIVSNRLTNFCKDVQVGYHFVTLVQYNVKYLHV